MSAVADDFDLLVSDEDEEDDQTFQRQVLFVPNVEEDEDLSCPPMDGFQFLKRVVAERKMCDAVVTKMVETKPHKNLGQHIPDFSEKKCNPEFYLDKETQMHIISEFSKLRLVYEARRAKLKNITKGKLDKLIKATPRKSDDAEWLRVFSNPPKHLTEALDNQESSVEICLAINQEKIAQVLAYAEDWLTEGAVAVPPACQWLHTLLACVNVPLDPDMCATMRGVARALIARRAQLKSLSSEELPHINLIVCIIGRYFNQLDLADPID